MDEQLKAFEDFQAFHESSKLASSMNKREAFAMAAMQALVASNDEGAGYRLTEIPSYAVQIADALLQALKETP